MESCNYKLLRLRQLAACTLFGFSCVSFCVCLSVLPSHSLSLALCALWTIYELCIDDRHWWIALCGSLPLFMFRCYILLLFVVFVANKISDLIWSVNQSHTYIHTHIHAYIHIGLNNSQTNLERYDGAKTSYKLQDLNSSALSRFLNVKNVSAELVWTPREFQTVGAAAHCLICDLHVALYLTFKQAPCSVRPIPIIYTVEGMLSPVALQSPVGL